MQRVKLVHKNNIIYILLLLLLFHLLKNGISNLLEVSRINFATLSRKNHLQTPFLVFRTTCWLLYVRLSGTNKFVP